MEQGSLLMARLEAEAGQGFWANAQGGEDVALEELEQNRQSILQAFDRDEIRVDVPVNNLVRLALSSALATAPVVFLMDWVVVRAPPGAEFILADTPVALYDPRPIGPSGAFGLLSSPRAETLLPLDPSYSLLVVATPDVYRFVMDNQERLRKIDHEAWTEVLAERDVGWAEAEADLDTMREMNLRSYAHAQRYVFGSQRAVTSVRADARRFAARLAQLRPPPPQLHILEEDQQAPDDLLRITHTITPRPAERRG